MQPAEYTCIQDVQISNLNQLNAVVAERTVQLSVAEEHARSALNACQQQFLDEECSQRRLQRLGTSLDSLVAVYAKKISAQPREASSEDQTMRDLAAMHSKVQALGEARKAVQLVHSWKNTVKGMRPFNETGHFQPEDGVQHLQTLWDSLQAATKFHDQLQAHSPTSPTASACLAKVDSGMANALSICLDACAGLITKLTRHGSSYSLQQVLELAPPKHRHAVLRSAASPFANAARPELTGKAASLVFLSLPLDLLDADARYWAVVASASPRGVLGQRPPATARTWQQALGTAIKHLDMPCKLSLETARQLLASAVANGGVELPTAGSEPAGVPMLPQAQDALRRALRADGECDALQAVDELQDIMADYLHRFQRGLSQCVATAALLPAGDAHSPAGGALQDAAVAAATHCIAPVLGMVQLRWLGPCLLAAAAGLGQAGGDEESPLASAQEALLPVATFAHQDRLLAWMQTAAAFGVDTGVSVSAIQEQLQHLVQGCTQQLRREAATAHTTRSREASDATDVFADDDDMSDQGAGAAAAPSSDTAPARALQALLLATTAQGVMAELRSALDDVNSSSNPASSVDVQSVLQQMLAAGNDAAGAAEPPPPRGAASDEPPSNVEGVAASIEAAQQQQLRLVLATMATDLAQGGDAGCAPAAFSSRFSESLGQQCSGLLVAAVDVLLHSAVAPLGEPAPPAAQGDAAGTMYSLQPSSAVVEACHALMATLQTCAPDVLAPALRACQHSRAPQATLGACLDFVHGARGALWEDKMDGGAATALLGDGTPPVLARAQSAANSVASGAQLAPQEEAAAFAALLVFCSGERLQAHVLAWMRASQLPTAQREVDAEHVESFLGTLGLHANTAVLQGAALQRATD